MKYSTVAGTGHYLPKRIVTNADIEKMVDTTDKWITERTGIKQRHIMADDETTSSMAMEASLKAISASGLNKADIQLIIVATATPDRIFPSTACILQDRLNIPTIAAFDVGAACSGFLFALSTADQYIKSGMVKNALVVGSEAFSRITDWSDRSTCVIFSDGAGAVVLKASDQPGILSTQIHSDGQYQKLLYAPNLIGETKEPAYIKMNGNEVFKLAVKTLGNIVDETLAQNGITKEAIDWLIPHQANLRIIKATAKKLALPMERVILTVQDTGNTSAASVPIALDIGIRDGRIKRGETLLLEAFGAGFTWGSALITY